MQPTDLHTSPPELGRSSRTAQRASARRRRLALAAMLAAAAANRIHAQGDRHAATAAARITGSGERVTIDELVAAAVQHSPGLAVAYADHREARNRDAAADAVDEWRVIARVNAQRTVLDRSIAGASIPLDTEQASAELGVERSLSTGGNIAITAASGPLRRVFLGPASRAQAVADDTVVEGITASARLAASQPLLRGAGADVARASQTTARLAAHALSAQAEDEAAKLVRDLVIEYWELAYAVHALAVDRDGAMLAQRQIAITQDVVRAGLQPPSALKIAELQVALREEAILRDELTIFDQSLAVRRLAGLELTTTPMVPGDELQVPAGRWSEAEVVAATLARSPSLAQRKLAQREADVAVDVAHDATLPHLDLTLSGEITGLGSSPGAAFGQLGEAQAYSVNAALSLQWDIGGAARAADGAARAHRTRLDAERLDLEHQLASAAMSAMRQLHLATQRIALTELAVRVADEALRAELVAFQSGRSTNVLVFQRQDDVAQARLRIARARIDAIEATALLQYLTGGLLARYGVTVDAARRAS